MKGGGIMKESEIIALIRKKEERGARELLCVYGPLMRYVIAPILSDERDREDCLSEAVMRVWEKIDHYDEKRGSWTAWLTAVTRNTALSKSRGKREELSLEEISDEVSTEEPTPEERLLHMERKHALRRALLLLSQRDQILFYRKYYYRQSTEQIASELGMTVRAVEGKLYRIRKELKKILGGDGYDGS